MALLQHTARAREDLIALWVEIALDDQGAADRIYDRLEARVRILESYPEAGPIRPDIDREARVLVEAPYLVLYRLILEGVQIVRVVHGGRHLDAALFHEGVE